MLSRPPEARMSTTPETEFDLERHFLPAWAKESSQVNRYAKFEGAPERSSDRGRDRRDRPPRRFDGAGPGGRPGGGRPGGPGGGRPGGGDRPGGPSRSFGPRPEGQGQGQGRPVRRSGPGGGRDQRDQRGARPVAPPPIPLPEINLTFIPDDYGVDRPSDLMDADAADPSVFGPRRLSIEECERAVRQSGPKTATPLLSSWPLTAEKPRSWARPRRPNPQK